MAQPAAKQGDQIIAKDTHIVVVPGSGPQAVTMPFQGVIQGELSRNVKIMGKPAATVGSTANNQPAHLPPPGTSFQRPPGNKATIQVGSATVRINGKPAARHDDKALTCNDPVDQPVGKIVATGTVLIG